MLECCWEDRWGRPDKNRTSKPVNVLKTLDFDKDGSVSIGTYIEGGVTNTHIEGDQLQSGAQKGDKVEVNRGSEKRIYEISRSDEKKEKSGNEEVRQEVPLPGLFADAGTRSETL